MRLFDAEIMAKELISKYIPDYKLEWNNHKKTYGMCSYATKTIFLSRPLTELCDENTVRDTVMHEIAHAMHPKAGHGMDWKIQMIRFGLPPNRLCKVDIDKSSISNWEATCRTCGKVVHMIRKPRIKRSCTPCGDGKYNEKYLLTFYRI